VRKSWVLINKKVPAEKLLSSLCSYHSTASQRNNTAKALLAFLVAYIILQF
jgi:hypothetical protein